MSLQAAVCDLTRAHAAFARMRAVGAWQTHEHNSARFVNVLLNAYGADVDAAWQWCGNSLMPIRPAGQPFTWLWLLCIEDNAQHASPIDTQV
jgi:hypothetical protein